MKTAGAFDIVLQVLIAVLAIACFPVNELVYQGIVHPAYYAPLYVLGWVLCVAGLFLAFSRKAFLRRHGGVQRGQTLANTVRVVDTGIYSVVRHPQYLGWMLAIFVATPFIYPDWLFVGLGLAGAVVLYLHAVQEEKRLIAKFGDQYLDYMRRVPRMNVLLGLLRRRNARVRA